MCASDRQAGSRPAGLGSRLRGVYDRWVADYKAFARLRGFESLNDWPYHRRGFLECWAEPGFHRFWQVWNPGIAYFVFRLYVSLGGSRRWIWATIGAFEANGLVHTAVVYALLGRWSYVLVVAFAAFAALTVASRLLAGVLRQERWPRAINVAVNVGLVLGSMDLGFRLDRLMR